MRQLPPVAITLYVVWRFFGAPAAERWGLRARFGEAWGRLTGRPPAPRPAAQIAEANAVPAARSGSASGDAEYLLAAIAVGHAIRHVLRRPGRLALVFATGSFLLWSGWYLLAGPKGPYGDLSNGIYTDHFSHMNSTRLFARVGIDICRRPLQASVFPLSAPERARLPADLRPESGQAYEVFRMPGAGTAKPFVASWAYIPRLHPPGDLIITAPVAALYEFTSLSFSGANRLLIVLLLLLAHLSLSLIWRTGVSLRRAGTLGMIALVVTYFAVIHWTLEGFYEATILAPLVLSARYLRQGRGLEALVAFSVAANIHFRAYFFAPLAIYAAWLILHDRAWRTWHRREWVLAGVAAALCLISLGVFATVWPAIMSLDPTDDVAVLGHVDHASVAIVVGTVALLIGVFVWCRSWLDVAIAAWLGLTVLLLRQTWEWDVVTLLAWLAFPLAASRASWIPLVRDARLLGALVLGTVVFQDATLLAPTWLQLVFR